MNTLTGKASRKTASTHPIFVITEIDHRVISLIVLMIRQSVDLTDGFAFRRADVAAAAAAFNSGSIIPTKI
jgi:hypothetical protein